MLWIDPGVFYGALDTAGFRSLVETPPGSATAGRSARPSLGMSRARRPLAGRARAPLLERGAEQSQRLAGHAPRPQRDQAEEIAQLREEQARLARDVHDVVGHSLAVILAQAESAQYLKDADTTALKQTMANIATSARTSLQDVRQVLTTTGGGTPAPARTAGLDSLVDGRPGQRPRGRVDRGRHARSRCRPSSRWWRSGSSRRCSPTPSSTGARDRPVLVERHWEGELRIEVRNVIDTSAAETQPLAMAEPVPEHRARGSTGCGAGSSRSAAASTYAGAPRPAARPSRRPRGSPVRSR